MLARGRGDRGHHIPERSRQRRFRFFFPPSCAEKTRGSLLLTLDSGQADYCKPRRQSENLNSGVVLPSFLRRSLRAFDVYQCHREVDRWPQLKRRYQPFLRFLNECRRHVGGVGARTNRPATAAARQTPVPASRSRSSATRAATTSQR